MTTDNPFISRTNPTMELHKAARLTPDGLSLWDILILVRKGFKAAFLESQERNPIIREAEKGILDMILQGIPLQTVRA